MFIFQPDFVRNQSYKLRIRRFSLSIAYCITEKCIDRIHLSAAPCHLDGMADGAFHPAGGSAVFLGDFRVQALGHGVDILRLVHGEQNGVPQELVYNR